jgi:serine/threonine-protein kinase
MAAEPTIESTPTPRERFGHYTVIRAVGSGAMGTVYEARHEGLDKRVALKVLNPLAALEPTVQRRFLREGQTAARIRHPHIVNVTDVGVQDGVPWLVMEFLEGEDLAALLEREGALPVERVADLMLPVISAIDAAHRASVLHRDLKPANIFLTRGVGGATHPIVVDFGIARVDDLTATGLTRGHALLGTPSYMAPEQASGATDIDARADQYALGVILYECVTGRRPFEAEMLLALVQEICRGTLRPPRELRPELPPGFEALVLRAMSRARDDRFPSVKALGQALLPFASRRTRAVWSEEFGVAQETTDHRVREKPAPAPPASRKNARIVGATAALVALAVIASVVGVLSLRAPVAPPPPSPVHPQPATLQPASTPTLATGITLPETPRTPTPSTAEPPHPAEPETIVSAPERHGRRSNPARTPRPPPTGDPTARSAHVPSEVTVSPGGTLILPP